jgi:archaellum component FlaC
MPEQVSDEKFKTQVMQFIEVANQKFDGLTADVRTNGFKLGRLESGLNNVQEKVGRVEEKLNRVASDVNALSGQFNDVAGMAIKDHHPRIERLEERVDVLEAEAH